MTRRFVLFEDVGYRLTILVDASENTINVEWVLLVGVVEQAGQIREVAEQADKYF